MKPLSAFALSLVTVAACGVEAPPDDTSTDVSALSASDVTHTYYSDATYTHVVGAVEIGPGCGPGKRQWGTVNTHWYSIDSVPCNHGFAALSCYEWQIYSIDPDTHEVDGDFVSVTCPSDITFEVGF